MWEESKQERSDIVKYSGFAEFAKHSIDRVESRVYLLSDLIGIRVMSTHVE